MRKSVCIVILNWNGWKDTVECVRSCQNLVYSDFWILLVDNGSTDGSEKILKELFPDHEILQTGRNLGFAGGNNVGIRRALDEGADYVWLLNNDTKVAPEALSELVRTIESKPDIGMVGSKILLLDHPDILHFAGGKVDLNSGKTTHFGTFEKDEGQYDHLSSVDYVTACSLLVKRDVIKEIGLLPEEYFLYFEETDWCMQSRKAGYTIHVSMNSRVYHKVSGSIEYTSPLKQYYLTRNRLYFLRRYGENVTWLTRVKSDLELMYGFMLGRKFGHARMILQAYMHWLFGCAGPFHSPFRPAKSGDSGIIRTEDGSKGS